MPTPSFGEIPNINVQGASLEELRSYVGKLQDHLTRLQRDMNYLFQHLDTENIQEVGGWRATPDQLASKDGDVGMSTDDAGADPIRFWAGDLLSGAPVFYVTKSGKMYAANGEFVGKITANEGEIGGFLITADALTALTGGRIENHSAAGNKVYLDTTGLHANDAAGVERLTIGTTPAKGAKALIGRDASGVERSVYTYDTETTYDGVKTGQFITAHGGYMLIDSSGHAFFQGASGYGFRAAGTRPELNDGFGWFTIAKKSEVDTKANLGASTGSYAVGDHNHGIPNGAQLLGADGTTVYTFVASGGFTHSHTQT